MLEKNKTFEILKFFFYFEEILVRIIESLENLSSSVAKITVNHITVMFLTNFESTKLASLLMFTIYGQVSVWNKLPNRAVIFFIKLSRLGQ